MYNYPYGDNQQINLNWIISEIIALHQRLDPDYTAPTFTQIYPFSETQQLNLDWILTELKALKDLAPTPPTTEEIDEIGQALIAGAYDTTTSYQKNDYIVQDGKLYRANAATTGTFDPTKWNEVLLGNDLAIITRWADATNTYLNNLAASNVSNDSSVAGDTVKDALGNLNTAITAVANKQGTVFFQPTPTAKVEEGLCDCWYDKSTNTVHLSCYVRNLSTTFGTADSVFTIPEEYRPHSGYGLFGIVMLNDGTLSIYGGRVATDGGIYQSLSGTARGLFFTGEYPVHS